MEKRLKANSNNKADANADVDGNEVDDEDNSRGLSGSADDVITRGENSSAGNANVSTISLMKLAQPTKLAWLCEITSLSH